MDLKVDRQHHPKDCHLKSGTDVLKQAFLNLLLLPYISSIMFVQHLAVWEKKNQLKS